MVRVILPFHLRTLAGVEDEVRLQLESGATLGALLDALEAQYPVLQGTIRDPGTFQRRPLVRFFACQEDLSHDGPESLLPAAVASGVEPLLIVGAMAGG